MRRTVKKRKELEASTIQNSFACLWDLGLIPLVLRHVLHIRMARASSPLETFLFSQFIF